jgi:hypothetical protein
MSSFKFKITSNNSLFGNTPSKESYKREIIIGLPYSTVLYDTKIYLECSCVLVCVCVFSSSFFHKKHFMIQRYRYHTVENEVKESFPC